MSGSLGVRKLAKVYDPEYENLLKNLKSMLLEDGWDVVEEIGEHKLPEEVDGRIPDIKARRSDGRTLHAYAEASACEDIESSEILSDIESLSNRRMKDSREEVPLYVAVPESCMAKARNVMDSRFPDRENIFVVGIRRGDRGPFIVDGFGASSLLSLYLVGKEV